MDQKYGLVDRTIHAPTRLTCSDVRIGTPICVPDGPHACSHTCYPKKGDRCDSIESMFGLQEGSIFAANTFLSCGNIGENTPTYTPNCGSTPTSTTTAASSTLTPANCKWTYYSAPNDLCESLENLASNSIKAANSFVDCTNIWPGTPRRTL